MAKQFLTQLTQASKHLQQQQFLPAIDLCTYVLERDKRNYNALQILGRSYFGLRRYDDAAKALEQAARIRTGDAMTHVLLGQIGTVRNKYPQALRSFDKALKLDPTNEAAIVGKAWVYDRQAQDDKLAAYLEPLMQGDDVHDGLLIAKANLLERAGRIDAAIDLLFTHARDESIPDTSYARKLLLQRGALCEKAGRFEDAMQSYIAGQQCAQTTPYVPEHEQRKIDHLIDVFSADNLARIPAADTQIQLPVFIIGMPRTGSTLIARIISAHPDAVDADEIALLGDVISDMTFTIGSSLPYPDCMLDLERGDVNKLGRMYADQLRGYGRRARRITDKMLNNYERVGVISRILPDARIIDCRRDPLDCCLSIFAQAFPPGLHPYQATMESLGFQFRQYQRLMDHWHDVLPDAFLTVQYEDLVADQETWSRRIIEYIGLPWDDRCLDFHKQKQEARTASRTQVTKPMYTSSVKRSERFGDLIDPLRRALAGD
jgi:tetratricopeptide (TPR) repeat protein